MKLRLNLLQTTKDCSYIKTFLRLQSPGSHNLRFAKKKTKKKSLRNIFIKGRTSKFSSFKKALITFTDGVLLVNHLSLELELELVCTKWDRSFKHNTNVFIYTSHMSTFYQISHTFWAFNELNIWLHNNDNLLAELNYKIVTLNSLITWLVCLLAALWYPNWIIRPTFLTMSDCRLSLS